MPMWSIGDEPMTATTGRDERNGGIGRPQRPTVMLGAAGGAAARRWLDARPAERPSNGDNLPPPTSGSSSERSPRGAKLLQFGSLPRGGGGGGGGAGWLLRGGYGRPIATVMPRTDAHGCPSKVRKGHAVVVANWESSNSIIHRDGNGVSRRGLVTSAAAVAPPTTRACWRLAEHLVYDVTLPGNGSGRPRALVRQVLFSLHI